MARAKAPAWTSEEIAILDDVFPREGINGAADALADRSWQAINVMASKRGLRSPVVGQSPEPKLQGVRLEEAIRLREVEGWAFARIGATLGVSESAACNAVLIALCPRKGFTPAQRDQFGRLTAEGMERLRLALRKGMKGVDIQLRLGVSASCIAEQRRRYRKDLKARGMAPIPIVGGGQRYSGVPVSRDERQAVEALLLQGYGSKKIEQRTGVSNTSVGRIRNRLIKRLARRGECLPGCDAKGRRNAAAIDSERYVPEVLLAALRERIMAGEPIARAAMSLSISASTAWKIRDLMVAAGHAVPRSIRGTRHATRIEQAKAAWLPKAMVPRFRALAVEHGVDQAIALLKVEIAAARAAERARPRTFEEHLAAVRAGAGLIEKIALRRPDPTMTLGGIASAAL